jgi:hypothetical protein
MAITLEALAAQMSTALTGLASAAETAKQNTESCKELRLTTERILKSQDALSVKVGAVETQMLNMGTRITSLESSVNKVLDATTSLDGRREVIQHQGTASERALDNGAYHITRNQHESGPSNVVHITSNRLHRDTSHNEFRMPKTNFPKFDGTHPKMWKEKADKYFNMFHVPEEYKVDYATLHFTGSAALWLQTYEAQHDIDGWAHLVVAVCQKFSKDLYYTDMNKALEIRQAGDVDAYSREFELLQNQLLAHNPALDDTFFVAKYVKGLRKDIRSAIILHKPRTVDAAISLALLQEAQNIDFKRGNKYEYKKWHNQAGPGKLGLQPADMKADAGKQPIQVAQPTKFDTLRAQRRAKGECFKCGGKYGPTHQCPKQIELAVMDALCEALEIELDKHAAEPRDGETASEDSGDSETEQSLCLSPAATQGTTSKRTMRLLGHIGQSQILILIDSGSSGNFISQELVDRLKIPVQPLSPVKVTIADGTKLVSDTGMPGLTWGVQQTKFVTPVRALPLKCYDMILGMDWLESCNNGKMFIDWKRKKMRFKHDGKRITLRGVSTNNTYCPKISATELHQLVEQGLIAQLMALNVSNEALQQEIVPAEILEVIRKHQASFQEPTELPPSRAYDHQIPLLPGAVPVQKKPYRYAPTQKDELEAQIKEMLQKGVIQESHSPYASPVILVKKKDGGWRMCIDYRYLNALTEKNKYPLPVVDELLDELSGSQYFTKLDLRSGYHQIRLVPGEEYKTAFKTHHGHWEFKVMPFGLTNAPATFQAAMNSVFADLLRKGVLIFMDDILIYTSTLEQHKELLNKVFTILQDNKFYVKQSKCSFAQKKLQYLGHVISAEGVATDPSKIQAIKQWPVPNTVKQVRAFLGLAGYYRKFIANYGTISRPLTELLRKGTQFIWSSVTATAFQTLKKALVEAPVLALPNFQLPFEVHTDASGVGIGAVLSQLGHPIAYLSKALSSRAQTLSTYEKECLALIMAVEKWKQYLQHREFTIFTDHKSLIHLEAQQLTNSIQHKAFCKLLGMQYKVRYKQGTNNVVADALSRFPDNGELVAMSVSTPRWLEIVVESYLEDDQAKRLLTELSIVSPNNAGYSLHNGVIKHQDRIWLGNHAEAKKAILLALHDSGVGGHSGFNATYHKVKALFSWPNLKQDVKNYVAHCIVCQQAKPEHVGIPGLLQPLPIPDKAWDIVSLDFVEGLPKSGKYDTILVVIDKFTKYGHFLPLSHPYTAHDVAQIYVDHIYKLHGLPKIIISNRDKVFTSNFWQQLFKITDTTLNMSSSYHPQTDGQTERLNQCMETYLRCMTQACPTKWAKWLSLSEFWYNTTFHSAIGKSPFEVLYGYKPRHFGL